MKVSRRSLFGALAGVAAGAIALVRGKPRPGSVRVETASGFKCPADNMTLSGTTASTSWTWDGQQASRSANCEIGPGVKRVHLRWGGTNSGGFQWWESEA